MENLEEMDRFSEKFNLPKLNQEEREMRETIVKMNKTKSCFFEKINKIEKPSARLIKKNIEESNQQN